MNSRLPAAQVGFAIHNDALVVTEEGPGYTFSRIAAFALVDSRPDPIRRAWSHLEAKWGMADKQEATAPRTPRPLVTRKGYGWPFRSWVAGWMASRSENASQKVRP